MTEPRPRPCLRSHSPTNQFSPTCGVPTGSFGTGSKLKARLCPRPGRRTLDRSRAGQTSTVSDPLNQSALCRPATLIPISFAGSGRPLTGPVSFVVRCHRYERTSAVPNPCKGSYRTPSKRRLTRAAFFVRRRWSQCGLVAPVHRANPAPTLGLSKRLPSA
jgi:hypothetical protein